MQRTRLVWDPPPQLAEQGDHCSERHLEELQSRCESGVEYHGLSLRKLDVISAVYLRGQACPRHGSADRLLLLVFSVQTVPLFPWTQLLPLPPKSTFNSNHWMSNLHICVVNLVISKFSTFSLCCFACHTSKELRYYNTYSSAHCIYCTLYVLISIPQLEHHCGRRCSNTIGAASHSQCVNQHVEPPNCVRKLVVNLRLGLWASLFKRMFSQNRSTTHTQKKLWMILVLHRDFVGNGFLLAALPSRRRR